MKKYKITYRWFGTEGKSEICEQFIESESVQCAIDKFNETKFDCPIRSVEEVPSLLLVDLIGSLKAIRVKSKDEAIRIGNLIGRKNAEDDFAIYDEYLCYGLLFIPEVCADDLDSFLSVGGYEIIDSNFVK